jgi:hypothetical protein
MAQLINPSASLSSTSDALLRFQPKQSAFDWLIEDSPASWVGYGGARGGAKSGAARRTMLRRRIEYPGSTGFIMRRVWKDVRENHVEKFFAEFPQFEPYYHAEHHEIVIPVQPASRIVFTYAENERDLRRKFLGPEFMDGFVDQAEQFTEQELVLMKTSCRLPAAGGRTGARAKFGLFFNPGGPGTAFLRRIFKTGEYHENENPADYAFVQAYGWDNVEWCREALGQDGLSEDDFYDWSDEKRFTYFIERSQYGRELNALPEAMRLGHLLGSFDQFAGQYFDIFDPRRHVREEPQLPAWLARWISVDWGFEHPAAVYWHAQAEKDRTVTYRELVKNRLAPRELAREIIKRTGTEKISAVYLSPDAFARRTDENTIAEQMGEVLAEHGLPRPALADDDRIGGWMLMYQLLQADCWTITPSCRKLIETLPLLVRDETDPEDALKMDGDDAADAARYGLKSRLGLKAPPLSERIAQRLADVGAIRADGTAVSNTWRAIATKKFETEERKKMRAVTFRRSRFRRPPQPN